MKKTQVVILGLALFAGLFTFLALEPAARLVISYTRVTLNHLASYGSVTLSFFVSELLAAWMRIMPIALLWSILDRWQYALGAVLELGLLISAIGEVQKIETTAEEPSTVQQR